MPNVRYVLTVSFLHQMFCSCFIPMYGLQLPFKKKKRCVLLFANVHVDFNSEVDFKNLPLSSYLRQGLSLSLELMIWVKQTDQ